MNEKYIINGSLDDIREFASKLDDLSTYDIYVLESILEVESDLQTALQILLDDSYSLYEYIDNNYSLGKYYVNNSKINTITNQPEFLDYEKIGDDANNKGHFTNAGFLIIH